MTVYVDNAFIRARVSNNGQVIQSSWCHLMADSVQELIDFARRLGLSASYLQDKPSGVHFDVTEYKRAVAVAMGAKKIDTRSARWKFQVAKARRQHALRHIGCPGVSRCKGVKAS